MIQDLRREEEERFDEEMDILREIEDGVPAIPVAKATKRPAHETQNITDAASSTAPLVEDSQPPDTEDLKLLGPDGAAQVSDEEDDTPQLGRDGKPLRVWKKKGLKRQTRRVNSKSSPPVLADSAERHD